MDYVRSAFYSHTHQSIGEIKNIEAFDEVITKGIYFGKY